MSIALFSEILANFPATRCADLRNRVPGGIDCVYALVWPDYPVPGGGAPADNRLAFKQWRNVSGAKLWAWINVQEDQLVTAAAIAGVENTLMPDGYLLDIEGEWTKGAKLTTVLNAVKATGKPCRCSLAGTTSSHVEYDYRGIDAAGFAIEWQSYWVSGEGQTPAISLQELWEPSFVIEGWQYRHQIEGKGYGWGRFVYAQQAGLHGMFDSYKIPGSPNCHFNVAPRDWGWTVGDRGLWQDAKRIGKLMGRARHTKLRVALDITRGAAARYTLPEWTAWAASARIPGVGKKPVAVYLAEVCPDDVLVAIGAGAAV